MSPLFIDVENWLQAIQWVFTAFGPASTILIAFIGYLMYQLRLERAENKEYRDMLSDAIERSYEVQLSFRDALHDGRDALKDLRRELRDNCEIRPKSREG